MAVRAECAKRGLRFQGFADELEQPDPNGMPLYSEILCTKTTACWKDTVVMKAVDPRKIGVFDMNRKAERQSYMNETNYLSLAEIRKCYPHNLDYFTERAERANANVQFPGDKPQTGDIGAQGSPDFPIYEVIEGWMDLDFDQAVKENKLSDDDIVELSERFKIPLDEFTIPGKWCIIHNKDRVLMDLYPSYLWDRGEMPWEIESNEPNEDRFCTHGFIHRISSPAAAVAKFRNFVMRNMRKLLNPGRIVAKRIQTSETELDKLDDDNGTAWVNGQAVDLNQDIRFMEIPDATAPGFSMISYFQNMMRQLGPSPAVIGEGDYDTATQADLNEKNGHEITSESFGRFVKMMMRAYKKHLGAMLISMTRGRMIRAAGEDGATFEETWIRPSDLTDRMEIIPMISFSDLQEERQSQFLIAMMNVFAPFLMPQEIRSIWKICMRKGGLSTNDLDEIEGSLGSYTDVQQEVDAMLADPSVKPEPRMDDPHPLCITVASMALQNRLGQYQMMGLMPPEHAVANLMDYIQKHEAMFQQQQMIAKLMAPQEETKGKPKNEEPKDGKDSQSDARQKGQQASPPDNGMDTNGGLTGMGAV
jgi:hypothetical protein